MKARPELLVLLACMRLDLNPAQRHELEQLLAPALDWDYLLRLAASHGVRPLLAKHVLQHAGVPEQAKDSLRRFSSENACWNLRLTAELLAICAELERRHIQHVVYKGPALSQYLCGSTALRESCDLDLLVRPEQRSQAMACLEELGFEDGYNLSASQRRAALRYGVEYGFLRKGVAVDLHWRLGLPINWSALCMAGIWKQVVPFTFCGQEIPVLSPEALLAALCVHAAQHDWSELKMFADVAELLRKQTDLNWSLVDSWAGNSHVRRCMNVSLHLASEYAGAALPAGLRDRISRDGEVAKIAAAAAGKWGLEQRAPAQTDVGWMLFKSKGERTVDRWHYVAAVALNPTLADFKTVALPSALSWGYLLLRPVRLMWKRLVLRRRPD